MSDGKVVGIRLKNSDFERLEMFASSNGFRSPGIAAKMLVLEGLHRVDAGEESQIDVEAIEKIGEVYDLLMNRHNQIIPMEVKSWAEPRETKESSEDTDDDTI